ncbi:MAG TPA: tetratricopeptide repeat protein, partial [Anaerolineales bacterium]|nr:tetratricopeptide repeat protein [Anaerolineales bacterium]
AWQRTVAAIEIDPYWPVHYANLAGLEWASDDIPAALIDVRAAAEADPKSPVFPLNLGWMEEQLGNEEQARRAYATVVELDPMMVRRLFFAQTNLRRSVADAALVAYLAREGAAELKGWLALDRNDWEEANSLLDEALSRDPRSGLSYAGKALALVGLGEVQDAAQWIEVALFLDPSSPYVLHSASQLALARADSAAAMTYLEASYRQARDISTSRLYYARAYFRFFLPGDLVPQLRTAVVTPDMASDFSGLADYYEGLGRRADAEEVRLFLVRQAAP